MKFEKIYMKEKNFGAVMIAPRQLFNKNLSCDNFFKK